MEGRICIVSHLIDDVVMSAGDELFYHGSGQHLFNLEGLSLVHECWNCNGSHVVGDGYRVPSSVIAAPRAKNAEEHGQRHAAAHWILPRGRLAAMASAHSTAFAAAMRRLSEEAHSQTPLG
jgi:hypothetical protein